MIRRSMTTLNINYRYLKYLPDIVERPPRRFVRASKIPQEIFAQRYKTRSKHVSTHKNVAF
jgi:hypothetical protein